MTELCGPSWFQNRRRWACRSCSKTSVSPVVVGPRLLAFSLKAKVGDVFLQWSRWQPRSQATSGLTPEKPSTVSLLLTLVLYATTDVLPAGSRAGVRWPEWFPKPAASPSRSSTETRVAGRGQRRQPLCVPRAGPPALMCCWLNRAGRGETGDRAPSKQRSSVTTGGSCCSTKCWFPDTEEQLK